MATPGVMARADLWSALAFVRNLAIGLSPLLQWLILPPVLVLAYRTLGPVLFGRHSLRSPIPAHDFTRGQT